MKRLQNLWKEVNSLRIDLIHEIGDLDYGLIEVEENITKIIKNVERMR